MICYRDMTFCRAYECLDFEDCDRAYTEQVEKAAAIWWGNANAPVCFHSDPYHLECYRTHLQQQEK